jgi:DNA-binding transcriptional regulator YdaS (Cro superfamily)
MTYDQLIRHFGTQSAAAAALGIKQPSVAEWKESIPPLRQMQIQLVTGGVLQADSFVASKKAAA